MLINKPFWYRFLWRCGWQPRPFKVLQEVARGLQHPSTPLGFVVWTTYDGDFHLQVGDRGISFDWRGNLFASGTNAGSDKEWKIVRADKGEE